MKYDRNDYSILNTLPLADRAKLGEAIDDKARKRRRIPHCFLRFLHNY